MIHDIIFFCQFQEQSSFLGSARLALCHSKPIFVNIIFFYIQILTRFRRHFLTLRLVSIRLTDRPDAILMSTETKRSPIRKIKKRHPSKTYLPAHAQKQPLTQSLTTRPFLASTLQSYQVVHLLPNGHWLTALLLRLVALQRSRRRGNSGLKSRKWEMRSALAN